jgi:hypothetical protein
LKPSSSPSAWGANGAFARINISDKIQWKSQVSLHVSLSNSKGSNVGCYNGYTYSGGKVRLVSTWRADGKGLSGCDIGTENIGCTVQSGTRQIAKYDSGKDTNSTGTITLNRGGDNVYATSGGEVSAYTHTAEVTFYYGSDANQASSSNAANAQV